MTSPFNKFQPFVANLANGGMNLGTDVLKVFLSNTAPTATSSKYADESAHDLATLNGYTAGGTAVTVASSTQTAGTYTLKVNNQLVVTASGAVGPFRYAILYDSAGTNKYLIGWWDYGGSITLQDTDTFTVDFDQTNGAIQLA